MSVKSNAAKSQLINEENQESEDKETEIITTYKDLEEKCEIVLKKINKRKNKK